MKGNVSYMLFKVVYFKTDRYTHVWLILDMLSVLWKRSSVVKGLLEGGALLGFWSGSGWRWVYRMVLKPLGMCVWKRRKVRRVLISALRFDACEEWIISIKREKVQHWIIFYDSRGIFWDLI